jgi:hypothetical protein
VTSPPVKALVAGSLAAVIVMAGVWAWYLSPQGLGDASEWSGVLQGFAALLTVPMLVLAVLALRAHGDGNTSSQVSDARRTETPAELIQDSSAADLDLKVPHVPATRRSDSPFTDDEAERIMVAAWISPLIERCTRRGHTTSVTKASGGFAVTTDAQLTESQRTYIQRTGLDELDATIFITSS